MVKQDGYGHDVEGSIDPEVENGDAGKPGIPYGALIVVIVMTSALFIHSGVASMGVVTAFLIYTVPIAAIASLAWRISKKREHTTKDKRRLTMFFIACYVLGFVPYLMTDMRAVSVSSYEGLSGDVPPPFFAMFLIPLVVLIPGLLLGLYFVTRAAPHRRPIPYLSIFVGILLVLLVFMQFPDRLPAEDMPATDWNVQPDDGEYLIVAPLWHYYLTRHEIAFLAIIIQFSAASMMLIFGSLWSLLHPEDFKRTFGFKQYGPVGPEPSGGQTSEEPPLKIYQP
jgi:hypothetical protein